MISEEEEEKTEEQQEELELKIAKNKLRTFEQIHLYKEFKIKKEFEKIDQHLAL